jgi:hypothetical protein
MYAFGILGYELYTGEGPYEAKSNTQWITAHLSGQPRDIERIRSDIDPAVASLLKRCMNREPNHRPSAANAASALQVNATGAVGVVTPEDATFWDALKRRRFPQFVGSALIVGAGVIAFVSEVVVGQFDQPDVLKFLSVPLALGGVAAATVITWFHGERGAQQSSALEWTLLGVIGVIWVSITAMIVIS